MKRDMGKLGRFRITLDSDWWAQEDIHKSDYSYIEYEIPIEEFNNLHNNLNNNNMPITCDSPNPSPTDGHPLFIPSYTVAYDSCEPDCTCDCPEGLSCSEVSGECVPAVKKPYKSFKGYKTGCDYKAIRPKKKSKKQKDILTNLDHERFG